MLFNSLVFLIFAALFFCFFWIVKKQKIQLAWIYIVLFSFVFYGWWDWRFLFLLIGSGLIDYIAGHLIYNYPKYKNPLLIISLSGNLGTLFAFKYSRFIFSQLESMLHLVGFQVTITQNIPDFFYILPVGISFYTFQSMSYTIDVYKGDVKPTGNIFHFFAYLSLFPQLVAGPIVRAKTLLPQLIKMKPTTEIERWHGIKLIAFGFLKKILLADNLAPMVNTAFADVQQTHSSLYWWLAILGFAFQIYCDFSGYNDIARGLAKMMGFHFKMNFNHPYTSSSIKEFWQRWHISLSTWFRDYVYIPLGGSRKGKFRSHLNMWITMIVSGFWHGASWNFIVWGWLHALYLSIERIFKWPRVLQKSNLKWVATFIVMMQVLIAWVFFRAQTFTDAWSIIINMLSFNTNLDFKITPDLRNGFYFMILAVAIEYIFYRIKIRNIIKNTTLLKVTDVFLIALMISITLFLRGKGHEFIYFQF
ncbi:MAG: MBOAT family protein [Salinivirgaceae bacterium]|nr:MBOAT family protein [Salinivirgaceae bacterium]